MGMEGHSLPVGMLMCPSGHGPALYWDNPSAHASASVLPPLWQGLNVSETDPQDDLDQFPRNGDTWTGVTPAVLGLLFQFGAPPLHIFVLLVYFFYLFSFLIITGNYTLRVIGGF